MTRSGNDASDKGKGPRNEGEGTRLQKVLAAAGVGSRRACEVMIDEGRVEVDGTIVTEQGMRVDPATAVIKVDGLRITTEQSGLTYLAVNKPKGVVSTMDDDEGRPDLGDFILDRNTRLFHVGRLDLDTEGLILLTNDGELAHRLTHPSFEVDKTYLVEVIGPLPRDIGKQMREGVQLDDGFARANSFRVTGRSTNRLMIELVIHEGRKHIVRRMFDAVDFPVLKLVRTKIGPIALGDLRPGTSRSLTKDEVGRLYREVGL